MDVSEHIRSSLGLFEKLLEDRSLHGEARERLNSFLHTMRIFHAEVLCYMKDWKEVTNLIQVSQ
jgi:hypothetical protein